MNYDKSNVPREKESLKDRERYREGGKQKQYQGLYMLYTFENNKNILSKVFIKFCQK